jgi:hypothetical protein
MTWALSARTLYREFEPRLEHGCLSLVCVVLSCVYRGLETDSSLIHGVLLCGVKTDQETIKVEENCIITEMFLGKKFVQ